MSQKDEKIKISQEDLDTLYEIIPEPVTVKEQTQEEYDDNYIATQDDKIKKDFFTEKQLKFLEEEDHAPT